MQRTLTQAKRDLQCYLDQAATTREMIDHGIPEARSDLVIAERHVQAIVREISLFRSCGRYVER